METLFNSINVNYSEYSYFSKKLDIASRASFLFQLFEEQQNALNKRGPDLAQFFKTIIEERLKDSPDTYITETYEDPKYASDPNRVDILIDDTNIMVESNSLKAIRQVVYRFIESGYILRRDKVAEKSFKGGKITRYLRIFAIIDQTSHICIN
jgi:hypothetical protein